MTKTKNPNKGHSPNNGTKVSVILRVLRAQAPDGQCNKLVSLYGTFFEKTRSYVS